MREYGADTLNLKEMMAVLKIGRCTALKLLQDGIIDGHRVAGKWLVYRSDVDEYIRRS